MTPTPDEVAARLTAKEIDEFCREWTSGDPEFDEQDVILKAICQLAKQSLSPPAGMVIVPTREELLGAIARGWCHPVNEQKVMDTALAEAINIEIRGLLSTRERKE